MSRDTDSETVAPIGPGCGDNPECEENCNSTDVDVDFSLPWPF